MVVVYSTPIYKLTLDIIPWGCVNSPTREHRTREGAFICAYIPQPVDYNGPVQTQDPRKTPAGNLLRPTSPAYNNLRDLGDQAGGPAREKKNPRGGGYDFFAPLLAGPYTVSSL